MGKEKKPVTPETLFEFSYISKINANPVKDLYVYVTSAVNKEDNGYDNSIWFGTSEGKNDRLIYGKANNPLWSPDGKYLAFEAKREKDFEGCELYILPVDGGEAKLLYKEKNASISKKIWSSDSKEMIINLTRTKTDKDKKDTAIEIEELLWWENGGTFTNEDTHALLKVKVSGKHEEIKFDTRYNIADYIIAPDNKKLYISFQTDREFNPNITSLYIYHIKEEKFEKTEIVKPYISEFVFDEEGKKLAFLSNDQKHGLNTNSKIHIYNTETGKIKILGKNDISFYNKVNSDSKMACPQKFKWIDGKFYFIASFGGKTNLYALNEKDETLKSLIEADGVVEDFDFGINNEIYFIYQNFITPGELYIQKDKKVKKITEINEHITKKYLLNMPERNIVKNGKTEIESWILMPYKSDKKDKCPAILEIHGGPKTAYGNAFMLEFHLLASQGYAVIFSNPRGSDAYGDDFSDIRGKYGTIDYDDLMKVVDYYLENYKIDEKKLGVTGGSYGGYMTNWIVTQTDRFKAAVTQRSISNWVSMYGTSDIGYYFTRDQIGGDFWDNLEQYIKSSPLFHAKNVKTPLLILHSFEDYRCWVPEAMQFYTALKLLGVKTRLVIFKNENHELSRSGKPYNRVKRYKEIMNWFENNL